MSKEDQISSLKDTMDAEGTENWIEQRSAAVAEWSTMKMGKKDRWEIEKAGEKTKLEPLESDVSTEAI